MTAADISSPRVACFRAACRNSVSLGEDRVNEGKAKFSGPDLTEGVDLSTVPDGTMLLGHVRGEPMPGSAMNCSRSVPSARTTVLRSNRGSLWVIRFDARGIMPVSAYALARFSARRR